MFTIPDNLSSLALGNREEIYDLLFRAAWTTLRDVITDEQGFEAAAAMMLHTWNQKLDAHAHAHALVPGGGPSLTVESLCAVRIVRIGIEMDEHPTTTRFAFLSSGLLSAERTSSCCAPLNRAEHFWSSADRVWCLPDEAQPWGHFAARCSRQHRHDRNSV